MGMDSGGGDDMKVLKTLIRILGAVLVILIFTVFSMLVSADDHQGWIPYIEEVCEEKNICPEFVQAIIERESNWNPEAENAGCIGLMQISERWHRERMVRLGVNDLHDPYGNVLVGVDYLSDLFEKYQDPALVLMIYNGDSRSRTYLETGEMSEYASWILERSAELERIHGK